MINTMESLSVTESVSSFNGRVVHMLRVLLRSPQCVVVYTYIYIVRVIGNVLIFAQTAAFSQHAGHTFFFVWVPTHRYVMTHPSVTILYNPQPRNFFSFF